MARAAIPVRRIDLLNGEMKEYPSITNAARENDTENIRIRMVLYGARKHHRMYKWERIAEQEG